jgi:hypothetical protein
MAPFRETDIGRYIQGLREARKKRLLKAKMLNAPARNPIFWTSAEMRRVKDMRQNGSRWPEIAEALGTGRTPGAVQTAYRRMLREQRKGR